MKTFADKVITFNRGLGFTGTLPDGIRIMNPFRENKTVMPLVSAFYKKFYDDANQRHLILGINPGRFGGGVTGIPFTDSKKLVEDCGIPYHGNETRETSAVYIYDMICAYGGPASFYSRFYINSMCPLGFTSVRPNGGEVNYNYYDSKELTAAVYDFMIDSIRRQLRFGINRDLVYCFGTGKNEQFLRRINDEFGFFKKIIALEHPRFIMQYKSKEKQLYIDKYIRAFGEIV